MKTIRWLLASLLAASLTLTATAWIIQSTIFSASYLEAKANQTSLYDHLIQGLPQALLGTTAGSDAQTLLQSALTVPYIRSQIEPLIPQIINHYLKGTPAPQFDISSLAGRITGSGYTIPPELSNILTHPKTIGGSTTENNTAATQIVQNLRYTAPLAALVIAAIIVVTLRARRWVVLAQGCFLATIGAVASAGLAVLAPQIIGASIRTSAAGPLADPIVAYATAISTDISRQFLIAAIIAAAAALLLLAVHKTLALRQRFSHKG